MVIKKYEKEDICKLLGAKKFQKLVYKVEHIKYYLLKNQLSFLIPMVEKSMKKTRDKRISKTNDINVQNMIDKDYKMNLMLFRKELNLEQNRNYHFNLDYTKNFKDYLLWNKKVHKKGITKDIIVFGTLVTACCVNPSLINVIIPFLVFDTISMGINFECINLQNYHLCRYEKVEHRLNERRKQEINKKQDKYNNAITSINKQIEESDTLPKLDLSKMSKEELYELRGLLLEFEKSNSTYINNNENQVINDNAKERRLHI